MKPHSVYWVKQFSMLGILFLFVLAGCKKDNSSTDGLDLVPSEVTGLWQVTEYLDSGDDETNDFKGITVEFANNGDFIISENGSSVYTGSWQIISDDGKTKLDVWVPAAIKPYSNFDDDWLIIEKSDDRLQLMDDQTASQEFMTLERL